MSNCYWEENIWFCCQYPWINYLVIHDDFHWCGHDLYHCLKTYLQLLHYSCLNLRNLFFQTIQLLIWIHFLLIYYSILFKVKSFCWWGLILLNFWSTHQIDSWILNSEPIIFFHEIIMYIFVLICITSLVFFLNWEIHIGEKI